jgi:hypothetical protein
MTKEIPKYQYFNGRRYYLTDNLAYYYWDKGYTRQLHRDIWEHYNGPIPKGYHIHHKDHNRLNNDISNLECLSASEHALHHRREDIAQGRLSYFHEAWMKHISTKAGMEAHRAACRRGWKVRKVVTKNCLVCHKEFKTRQPHKLTCTQVCKQKKVWQTWTVLNQRGFRKDGCIVCGEETGNRHQFECCEKNLCKITVDEIKRRYKKGQVKESVLRQTA